MLKTLYTTCLMVAGFCTISNFAQAQLKRFSIGPYVEVGSPVGDFKDTHKTGFGAGLNADVKLIAGFGVTGSAGFMYFPGKSLSTSDGQGGTINYDVESIKALPIKLGIKYKLPIPLLYVKVEGGTAKFLGDDTYDGAAAIFAPGIGIRFLGLDVQAKYEAWFKDGDNLGFFGLKAGYNF
jgi:hypothetical protein